MIKTTVFDNCLNFVNYTFALVVIESLALMLVMMFSQNI